MSKRKDGQARGKYTLEFKLEAVRLVKGGYFFTMTPRNRRVGKRLILMLPLKNVLHS